MNKAPVSNVSLYECGTYHRQNNTESVCWNSTGTLLASSTPSGVKLWNCPPFGSDLISSSTTTNNSSSSSGSAPTLLREYLTLDHRNPVRDVRFHPLDSNLLCSNVKNGTIQIWDIRSRNTCGRPVDKIHLKSSSTHFASTMEWIGGYRHYQHQHHPRGGRAAVVSGDVASSSHHLLIGEMDDSLHVYDLRKLQQPSNNQKQQQQQSQASSSVPIQSFNYSPHELTGAQFTPSGTHLISAIKNDDNKMGCLIVHPLKQSDLLSKQLSKKNNDVNEMLSTAAAYQFIGHCSKIYSIRFSPNGQYMATGGNDALVALWDIQSMTCTSTITRRHKSIRSLSFSHDSKLLACCSEEDGIDISYAHSGELIANINISRSGKNVNLQYGGADEIAFHPKSYLLACARGRDPRELGAQVPFVTIAKVQDVFKV